MKQLIADSLKGLKNKGTFTRNIAIVFSGSVLVTLISFLLTPVLSRIYTPDNYGSFYVFSAIATNLGLICSVYVGAFVLEKDDKKFFSIVQLSLIIGLSICLFSLIAILLFKNGILAFFNIESIGNTLFLLPVIILASSLYAILKEWMVRDKRYSIISGSEITVNLGSRISAIYYGLAVAKSATGLIIGEVFSRFLGIIILLLKLPNRLAPLINTWSWKEIRHTAIRYKDFVIYQLPTYYIDFLASQLPIYALTVTFSSTEVGYFSFAATLLELPVTIIGRSISPVFSQKSAELHRENPGELGVFVLKLYNRMILIGIVPVVFILVFGSEIFKNVFGANWERAGLYASWLGYAYIFKLFFIATLGIFPVLNRQKLFFQLLLLGFLLRGLALVASFYAENDLQAIMYFSIASFLTYFIINIRILQLLKLDYLKISARILFWLVVLAGFFLMVKKLLLSLF